MDERTNAEACLASKGDAWTPSAKPAAADESGRQQPLRRKADDGSVNGTGGRDLLNPPNRIVDDAPRHERKK